MRIVVRGIPAAQGSKRHVGGGRMVESSRAVGPWREAVRAETQRVAATPLVGAVGIDLAFFLPRPKSLPKRITRPAKRPDLDKLVRSTLDGLTEGGAWSDDSQVVRLIAAKHFASPDALPGCYISIDELEGS